MSAIIMPIYLQRAWQKTDSIEKLVSELTTDEKILLCEGVDSWQTNEVSRLSVPSLFMTDGPHGLRRVRRARGGLGVADNERSTSFPCSAAVASSWDPDNSRKMAGAIAEEAAEAGVGVILAPAVNIKRNPLCGRNFEYFSEEPLLAAHFGAAFVEGLKERGIGAAVKHFAANSCENSRYYGNSLVDERALREIWLRAFEYIVRKTSPASVMCAYNRINGVFCADSRKLLTGILRDEWGFSGLVMSDWGATHDRVEGIKAGCDLDMPGGVVHNRLEVKKAVENGGLKTDELDRSVKRVLAFVNGYSAASTAEKADTEANARLSCDIAADSAVLLKAAE